MEPSDLSSPSAEHSENAAANVSDNLVESGTKRMGAAKIKLGHSRLSAILDDLEQSDSANSTGTGDTNLTRMQVKASINTKAARPLPNPASRQQPIQANINAAKFARLSIQCSQRRPNQASQSTIAHTARQPNGSQRQIKLIEAFNPAQSSIQGPQQQPTQASINTKSARSSNHVSQSPPNEASSINLADSTGSTGPPPKKKRRVSWADPDVLVKCRLYTPDPEDYHAPVQRDQGDVDIKKIDSLREAEHNCKQALRQHEQEIEWKLLPVDVDFGLMQQENVRPILDNHQTIIIPLERMGEKAIEEVVKNDDRDDDDMIVLDDEEEEKGEEKPTLKSKLTLNEEKPTQMGKLTRAQELIESIKQDLVNMGVQLTPEMQQKAEAPPKKSTDTLFKEIYALLDNYQSIAERRAARADAIMSSEAEESFDVIWPDEDAQIEVGHNEEEAEDEAYGSMHVGQLEEEEVDEEWQNRSECENYEQGQSEEGKEEEKMQENQDEEERGDEVQIIEPEEPQFEQREEEEKAKERMYENEGEDDDDEEEVQFIEEVIKKRFEHGVTVVKQELMNEPQQANEVDEANVNGGDETEAMEEPQQANEVDEANVNGGDETEAMEEPQQVNEVDEANVNGGDETEAMEEPQQANEVDEANVNGGYEAETIEEPPHQNEEMEESEVNAGDEAAEATEQSEVARQTELYFATVASDESVEDEEERRRKEEAQKAEREKRKRARAEREELKKRQQELGEAEQMQRAMRENEEQQEREKKQKDAEEEQRKRANPQHNAEQPPTAEERDQLERQQQQSPPIPSLLDVPNPLLLVPPTRPPQLIPPPPPPLLCPPMPLRNAPIPLLPMAPALQLQHIPLPPSVAAAPPNLYRPPFGNLPQWRVSPPGLVAAPRLGTWLPRAPPSFAVSPTNAASNALRAHFMNFYSMVPPLHRQQHPFNQMPPHLQQQSFRPNFAQQMQWGASQPKTETTSSTSAGNVASPRVELNPSAESNPKKRRKRRNRTRSRARNASRSRSPIERRRSPLCRDWNRGKSQPGRHQHRSRDPSPQPSRRRTVSTSRAPTRRDYHYESEDGESSGRDRSPRRERRRSRDRSPHSHRRTASTSRAPTRRDYNDDDEGRDERASRRERQEEVEQVVSHRRASSMCAAHRVRERSSERRRDQREQQGGRKIDFVSID